MSLLSLKNWSSIKSGQLEQLLEVKLDGLDKLLPTRPVLQWADKRKPLKLTCSSYILRKGRGNDTLLLLKGQKHAKGSTVCCSAWDFISGNNQTAPRATGMPHRVPDNYSHFASFQASNVSPVPKTNQKVSTRKAKKVGAEGDSWRVGPTYRPTCLKSSWNSFH